MSSKKIVESIAASYNLSPRKLGLRFDKVALHLVNELEIGPKLRVPKGKSLIVSVTAPIRLPAQTIMALDKKIASLFTEKNTRHTFKMIINSNKVQIRIVEKTKKSKVKIVAFIHNPTTKPKEFMDLIENWLTNF